MKKKVWMTCIGLVISLSFLVIYFVVYTINNELPKVDKIESVRITFLGDPVDWETSFAVSSRDNILEAFNVHQELNDYEDALICSVKQDVLIEYELKNGKSKSFRIKGIRCPEDYFESVMDTEEVKKQLLSIFRLDEKLITAITVSDHYIDRDISRTVSNKDEIEYLIRLAQEAALKRSRDRDEFAVVYLDFYIGEEQVATHIICREDEAVYKYLQEHPRLSEVLLSPSEIDSILIRDDRTGKSVVLGDEGDFELVIEHFYDGHSSMRSVLHVEFIMKDNESRHWYGSFYKGNVPGEIEKWIGREDWY